MSASKEELTAAMYRLADALRFVRGPGGEIIYLGEKIPQIAFHLARAGADVDPVRAIIKARPVPARPGGVAGAVDWVPVDSPDSQLPDTTSVACGSHDVDPDTFWDALPWHVKTKIQGDFR